jgi:4-amino-4-deoxy-L-arabinose transferase-like glycosyltransferase
MEQNPGSLAVMPADRTVMGLSWQTAAVFLILLLGLSLRLVGLGSTSLWTDEFHTLRVAQEALFWNEGIPGDQHPPLYYLLIQFVTQYSTGEFWLRLPSAVFGFLALPIIWQIGLTLNRPRWGLLAMALFALAPLFIWYSRDARMYSMAAFFWLLSLHFYLRIIYHDDLLDLLGWAASTLAGIFTAYPTMALWILQLGLFYFLLRSAGRDSRRLTDWLLVQVVVAVGLWGWSPYFTIQMGRTFQFSWYLGPVGVEWSLQQTMTAALLAGAVGLLAMILVTAVILRRPSLQNWIKQWQTPAAWAAVLLLLAVTLAGVVPRGLSIRRQLLVFLPFIIGGGAWGLIFLNQRRLTGLVLALTLLAAIVTAAAPPYENWKEAIALVEQQQQPGDQIITAPGWQQQAFAYYYHGSNQLWWSDERGRLRVANANISGEPADFAPGQRVWVVANSHPAVLPYSNALLQRLDQTGRLQQRTDFSQNVTVFLYIAQ